MTNLASVFKSKDITLSTKVHIVKGMVFPVVMYRCESWTIKKAEHQKIMFWIAVLEKTLESTCKEIKPVNSKGNQSRISTGRTDADAEVESPILWPLDVKHQLIGKDPDAGKDWKQEEKETTEDEMVGWLTWLTDSMDMSLSKLQETWRTGKPHKLQFTGLQRVRHDLVTEQQQ